MLVELVYHFFDVNSNLLGPGQCYRLYSTACYSSFCPETIPEIKRCNIANTLLYLKVLGITDVIGYIPNFSVISLCIDSILWIVLLKLK